MTSRLASAPLVLTWTCDDCGRHVTSIDPAGWLALPGGDSLCPACLASLDEQEAAHLLR